MESQPSRRCDKRAGWSIQAAHLLSALPSSPNCEEIGNERAKEAALKIFHSIFTLLGEYLHRHRERSELRCPYRTTTGGYVKTTSKKFSTLALAAALIAASLVAGTSSANAAAAKANGACAKAGAKTTIAKTKFTCGVSPISTSKKLTWVSATCTSASVTYGKAAQQQKTLVDAEVYAESKLQKVIDSFIQTRDLWLKAQDEYQKRIDSAIAANPKANTSVDTTGMTNAKTRAESADKKVISWQGILADTKKTQSTLLAQGEDNLAQAKKDMGTICKSGY